MRCYTYPSADTASAGGDLEVAVQVFDSATGEESFHHQQDTVHKEGRGDAVDHVLDDVNPVGRDGQERQQLFRRGQRGGRVLVDIMSRKKCKITFP